MWFCYRYASLVYYEPVVVSWVSGQVSGTRADVIKRMHNIACLLTVATVARLIASHSNNSLLASANN